MKLRDTFQSPYEQYAEHVGKSFKVIGPHTEGVDPEVGPMYDIRLSDGEVITAWPEEIYVGTGWEPSTPHTTD